MAYSPHQIANYFIEKFWKEHLKSTPLKIIKLVYLAHGWHLAIKEEPLINELIEIGEYGPLIRSIYNYLLIFGNSFIDEKTCSIKCGKSSEGFVLYTPEFPCYDEETKELLNKVWEVYKGFSGIQLASLCHQEGTPWYELTKGGFKKNTTISNELIKKYFKDRAFASSEE